jgi:nicotinamide mononucleotide transporter
VFWIEIFAALFGLGSVFFVTYENILNFPLGIISVMLYAMVFFHVHLYADMVLQGFYFILQLYGWWEWKYKLNDISEKHIRHLTYGETFLLSMLGGLGAFFFAFYLHTYTDAQWIVWDTMAAVGCIIGQYCIAKKIFECWPLFIMLDAVYVVMYCGKHLYSSSLLFALFFVLAVIGYQRWQKGLLQ